MPCLDYLSSQERESEEVLDAVAGEQLRSLLSRLTERAREIVHARFGFDRPRARLRERLNAAPPGLCPVVEETRP